NSIANNNTLSAAVTGTGTATDSTGAGNVWLNFSDQVTSISFTYGNGPGTQSDPGQQAIGIGDITYTVVPEPSAYLSGLLLLGLAGRHWWRRRSLKNTTFAG